jgi:threonine dehydrogenase-like Zn-dependent dehydrogenase
MRALVLRKPGQADLETITDPAPTDMNVLLRVRMVGFCGSDLNSFRGLNPLVTYPRILGHEVSATVVEDLGRQAGLPAGTSVAVYIGYAKEPVSYETRLFVQKELDIVGSRNAQPADFEAVIKLLEAQTFPVDQAVSLVVPLEQAADALRSWSENPRLLEHNHAHPAWVEKHSEAQPRIGD